MHMCGVSTENCHLKRSHPATPPSATTSITSSMARPLSRANSPSLRGVSVSISRHRCCALAPIFLPSSMFDDQVLSICYNSPLQSMEVVVRVLWCRIVVKMIGGFLLISLQSFREMFLFVTFCECYPLSHCFQG